MFTTKRLEAHGLSGLSIAPDLHAAHRVGTGSLAYYACNVGRAQLQSLGTVSESVFVIPSV